MSWLFKQKEPQKDFVIDAQKELGYYIKSGELLQVILQHKRQINRIRAIMEAKTTWVFTYAKRAATYRWLIKEMMLAITQTNSVVHEYVLPFIQPEQKEKKARAVDGYTQIYIDTMNENYMLLQDLEMKPYRQQKTLVFQRVINNYALFFSIAEFLNGISPDRDFVVPSKDRVFVLPAINNPYNTKGVNMNDILDKL